jgi:hypothetical protein
MRGMVWDTASSCATIIVALRYNICSKPQEGI